MDGWMDGSCIRRKESQPNRHYRRREKENAGLGGMSGWLCGMSRKNEYETVKRKRLKGGEHLKGG